jgi:aminoglycoside phosphotransferase (APT) family kinase protein
LGARGLTAVIDFGDLCAGDPATDFAIGWMLFDESARAEFRNAALVDDDTWKRGRAWAIALGLAWATGGERMSTIGHRTLTAAISEDA